MMTPIPAVTIKASSPVTPTASSGFELSSAQPPSQDSAARNASGNVMAAQIPASTIEVFRPTPVQAIPGTQPPASAPASEDSSAQKASVGGTAAQLPAKYAKASHAAPANKASSAQAPATAPAAAPKSSASIAAGTIQAFSPDPATATQPPAKVSASKGPPGLSSSQAPTKGPQQAAAGASSALRPVPVAAPPGLQLPLTAPPAAPPQSAQTPTSTNQPSRPVLDTPPPEKQLTAPAPIPQNSSASSSHQAPGKIPVQIPAGTIKVSRPGAAATSPASAPMSSVWTGLPPFYGSLAEAASPSNAMQTEALAASVVGALTPAGCISCLLIFVALHLCLKIALYVLLILSR